MQQLFMWLWIGFCVATLGMIVYGMVRTVSNLYWKVVICLIPTLLSAVVVTQAYLRYQAGLGGFKLGVDLVGGTILVYEIDPDRKKKEDYKSGDLAAALKRRIDPNDLYNVTIRPVGDTRVEIILPTGGALQAQKAQAAWNGVLQQVNDRYKDQLEGDHVEVGRGQVNDLGEVVVSKIEAKQWAKTLHALTERFPALKDNKDVKLSEIPPGARVALIGAVEKAGVAKGPEVEEVINANYHPEKLEDVRAFVKNAAGTDQQRKDLTGEEVENIKAKIREVGSLEFRILANEVDDRPVIEATRKFFNEPANPAERKEELDLAARDGKVPPLPKPEEGGRDWLTTREDALGRCSYVWVELGKNERETLQLSNRFEGGDLWQKLAAARDKNQVFVHPNSQILLYSRKCTSGKLPPREVEAKKYEYFALTRWPDRDPDAPPGKDVYLTVSGEDLIDAKAGADQEGNPAVHFTFNSHGARCMQNMTSKNRPSNNFGRLMCVILDDYVESAATVQETISGSGQIHGMGTQERVDALVTILRSGALPATLKPLPVSENTIGPTLGQDTIDSGVTAVGWAFVAVLIFMCIYYRFAGFVASTALLANLLLTVAFMVFVNATFTLPGLAGLVLTLGMAVDANVLIYERLREERDKGANLLLALRNGYDRALPTIIDTHLTSIFTAIVLYVVGNDQLKGFGVSLAAGLVISLFTSLFMTRTIFDLWVKLDLLKKLSMFRFLTKPNVDFMRIRYYWFTATLILTVLGIAVFMIRGPAGLNIDFVGGTALSGQLKDPIRINGDRSTGEMGLRDYFGDDQQTKMLAVKQAQMTDDDGREFAVTYQDGQTQNITLANKANGDNREAMQKDVQQRASVLPDWSVEQIFLSSEPNEGGRSRYFTVRTTEKEADLVQVAVNRLLRDASGGSLLRQVHLQKYELKNRRATLEFSDNASPGFVKVLVARELRAVGIPQATINVAGEGEQVEGRYKRMAVDFSAPALGDVQEDRLRQVLERTKNEFELRPQPERLENFDAQLAARTQSQAAVAVLLSWGAILLYLWFRFGSWTFGAAAVLCLLHDLFFTIGIIAFCHYIAPTSVAHWLKIEDFKIDLPAVAALLTLIGYSVSDTIVVFDRIREVRGKNPLLTPDMINASVNQTLSRTLLASTTVFLVVLVLYWFGGEGVHLFAFVMVVGVIVGTYSSIYIASPLLLIFGEGQPEKKHGAAPAPTAV